MRLVFFGSPDFAISSLNALAEAGHEISLVVSQPAKPVGRKAIPTEPPVARRAAELKLPIYQPEGLKGDKGDDVMGRLGESGADLFVVVAYGKILPERLLRIPRLGAVNAHGSLLPRWRGASPVQAALLAGDVETGVSLMKMEAGMDTGPVYATTRTPLTENETGSSLSARLAGLGAALLVDALPLIEAHGLEPLPQDDALATYCPKIEREDGRVDWTQQAVQLARMGRAFTPWPGLFAFRGGARVKLSNVEAVVVEAAHPLPGTVLDTADHVDRIVVACGHGALAVGTLQAEGRRALDAAQFVRGERVAVGEVWS